MFALISIDLWVKQKKYATTFAFRYTEGTPLKISCTLSSLGLDHPAGYAATDLFTGVELGTFKPRWWWCRSMLIVLMDSTIKLDLTFSSQSENKITFTNKDHHDWCWFRLDLVSDIKLDSLKVIPRCSICLFVIDISSATPSAAALTPPAYSLSSESLKSCSLQLCNV